jgi:glycerol-3-phosphate acyltransferase PlsY
MAGFDLREKGSGNAGTTNMLRTVGKKAAIITLLCDILKGIIPVLLAVLIGNIANNFEANIRIDYLAQIAGIATIIGHTYPIFFKFKGGKGVASSIGLLLIINWQVGLICLVFGILVIAVTRMVSLGSITSAILFAVLTLFGVSKAYYITSGNYIIFGIILAIIVIFNHRSNIKRILNGSENKLSFSNKKQ